MHRPMTTLTESDVEQVALDWLSGLGWQVAHGPDIAPDTPGAERADYGQVLLQHRLGDAIAQLNPDLPATALEDAFRRLTRPEGATLEARNRAFHRMLVNGVDRRIPGDPGARVRGEPGKSHRFRNGRTDNDFLRRQPVHGNREPHQPQARRRAVRQRPASRR